MLIDDTNTRDRLARLIRKSIDDLVSIQTMRGTQEPAITARIGERLESQLNGRTVNGFKISVITQDLSDRGKGSQESRIGADLYVGIRVENAVKGFDLSKGLLVQAKMASSQTPAEQERLAEQCRKLAKQSSAGAYVWIYDKHGVQAVPASEVLSTKTPTLRNLASKNVTMHFRDIFDCVAGDVGLASAGIFEGPGQLKQAMQELSARSGVAISLTKSL